MKFKFLFFILFLLLFSSCTDTTYITTLNRTTEINSDTHVNGTFNLTGSPLIKFPMGEIYMISNTDVTDINATNQWETVNGTSIFNTDSYLFNFLSNSSLNYNDNYTRMCHVAVTLSVSSAGANDIYQAGVFKNEVLLNGSIIEERLAGAGSIGSSAIHIAPTLKKGDNITLKIRNIQDADDLTAKHINLFAMCSTPM